MFMALLLHGNNLDETLWLGAAILLYFLFLFIYSRIKAGRRQREKLRRKAARAAATKPPLQLDNLPSNQPQPYPPQDEK